MTTPAAWAAAATIISTGVQLKQMDEAQDARQRAAEQRQEVQKQRNFRKKQQELRRARAARAQAVSRGVTAGVETGGTSAVQGTRSSIQSQAASNVSFLEGMNRAGASITDAEMDAQGHMQTANIFGEIAGSTRQTRTIFEEVGND